jgi:H+/Cl- antiporter ClcA
MDNTPVSDNSTTEGLPVAVSLGPVLEQQGLESQPTLLDQRTWMICLLALGLGVFGFLAAQALMHLIGLITNLCFYGRFSLAFSNPSTNLLGLWVILVPIAGGLVVGVMARYGSKAIRGHGIPEAMETVLVNESRIPARVTLLKPISAAISIGTGGPFGAEGPIIATGGAFGSLIGQWVKTSPTERKILLASGAAAGMAATFGSPVSSVLLAVELLLFEFRPRSLVPVALASATAAGLRLLVMGSTPIFAMPHIAAPTGWALPIYAMIGALFGLLAVGVTRAVYLVEDLFEKYVRVHWMWWPAIGAVVVGVCGYLAPRTLGVRYDNISAALSSELPLTALAVLAVMKWLSWTVSLSSGTSGGTLAPLFTIGSSLGAVVGGAILAMFPHCGVNVRVAALVGMAALFTGCSRAFLTAVVFAFETTLEPMGLLPLLAGCTTAFWVSCLLMRHTIMTEKIARRGITAHSQYSVDFMDQLRVRDAANKNVTCLSATDTIGAVRKRFFSKDHPLHHHGFPVVDEQQRLVGFVTTRDLVQPDVSDLQCVRDVATTPPVVITEQRSLREADRLMARHHIGRLIVVPADNRQRVVGILTRSDLLAAHRQMS